jgi:hypothetical protein
VRPKKSAFARALAQHEPPVYQPPPDEATLRAGGEKSADLENMSVEQLRAELTESRRREQEAREIAKAVAQEQASLLRSEEATETLASRLKPLKGTKGKHWS